MLVSDRRPVDTGDSCRSTLSCDGGCESLLDTDSAVASLTGPTELGEDRKELPLPPYSTDAVGSPSHSATSSEAGEEKARLWS